MPFRLLGCFRGSEMHGGCAIGIIGHRTAGRPYPSLTPYLGVLYPSSTAKYVTEISNNKEIGSAFAVFLKSEFEGSWTSHFRRKSSICSRSFGKDLRLNCVILTVFH